MRLAAIDLGSNSFRLEIVRVDGESISTELYLKEGVRLAAGVDSSGYITDPYQQKALNALEHFRHFICDMPPSQVQVVGTQTLRSAKNTEEFLNNAQKVLGYPIEILSGQEEARLVFKGCAKSLPPNDKKRLILDIGGASTEIITGIRDEVTYCESFHVGCVNTTVEYFKNYEITPSSFEAAYLSAQAEFSESRLPYRKEHWQIAYGASGSMEALCLLCGYKKVDSTTFVTRENLLNLKDSLLKTGHARALDIPQFPESRKGVVAGGLAVLLAACDTFEINKIYFAPGALRRGVLYTLLEKNNGYDLRDYSLELLLKQTSCDLKYCRRQANQSLTFFKMLRPNANVEIQKLVYWAAMSLDIGKKISPNRHHHHSAYLLKNCHLAGFSKTQQDWVANLVLGHRGKLEKIQTYLADEDWCSSLLALRIVALLNHEDNPIIFDKIELKTLKIGHWIIKIKEPNWLDLHPLTFFLLRHEVDVWKALKYKIDIEFE